MSEIHFKHVVEIGAGDSASSQGAPLYKNADKISLYEPNALLRSDLVFAAESVPNIEVFPFAVSNERGLKNFYHFGYASYLEGAKSFLALAEDEKIDPVFWLPLAKPIYTVPMSDIDVGDIDFLILTPNGTEIEILSCMKSRPERIRFKVHLHNRVQVEYSQRVCDLLNALGYTEMFSLESNEHSTFHHIETRLK